MPDDSGSREPTLPPPSATEQVSAGTLGEPRPPGRPRQSARAAAAPVALREPGAPLPPGAVPEADELDARDRRVRRRKAPGPEQAETRARGPVPSSGAAQPEAQVRDDDAPSEVPPTEPARADPPVEG